MKRAEMTLQTIVVAILVLTVLAVLLFMFYNSTKTVNKGINSCENTGGECLPKETGCKFPEYAPRSGTCSDLNTVCCQPSPLNEASS